MNDAEVDNRFFARLWTVVSAHESEPMRRLRRQNLSGLAGRVLEVGAGTGTNFAFYPDTVTEVVAVEPERRLVPLAERSAAAAPVPVTVTQQRIEEFTDGGQFDAVVCSLVLCSVDDPEETVRQLASLLRAGGELRFLEHVASPGVRGRLQRTLDATFWPPLMGNCHTHRHTEEVIAAAGLHIIETCRHTTLPAWVPSPVTELATGVAMRPA